MQPHQQLVLAQQDIVGALLPHHHLRLHLGHRQQADPLQPDRPGGGGGVPDVLPLRLLLHVPPVHPPLPRPDSIKF